MFDEAKATARLAPVLAKAANASDRLPDVLARLKRKYGGLSSANKSPAKGGAKLIAVAARDPRQFSAPEPTPDEEPEPQTKRSD